MTVCPCDSKYWTGKVMYLIYLQVFEDTLLRYMFALRGHCPRNYPQSFCMSRDRSFHPQATRGRRIHVPYYNSACKRQCTPVTVGWGGIIISTKKTDRQGWTLTQSSIKSNIKRKFRAITCNERFVTIPPPPSTRTF